MCQEKCPVKINTGELIKDLRARDIEAAASEGGIAMVRPALCERETGVGEGEERQTDRERGRGRERDRKVLR
jgi:hypothetical protein